MRPLYRGASELFQLVNGSTKAAANYDLESEDGRRLSGYTPEI